MNSQLIESMLLSKDEEVRKLGVLVIKNSFIYPSNIEFILNDIVKYKFEKTSIQNFIKNLINYNEEYKRNYFNRIIIL